MNRGVCTVNFFEICQIFSNDLCQPLKNNGPSQLLEMIPPFFWFCFYDVDFILRLATFFDPAEQFQNDDQNHIKR